MNTFRIQKTIIFNSDIHFISFSNLKYISLYNALIILLKPKGISKGSL